MAILNDGINGGFTGKVGTVVGYQLNGKWVIRSLPKSSIKNRVGTSKQQNCRHKFVQMQHFLSRVLGFIRVGFNLEARAGQMSAHNAAKSYNMIHAFDDAGTIDYSKVRLTQGILPGPQNAAVQVSPKGLRFTWENSYEENTERAYDQVMLMAFNGKKRACMLSGEWQ